MDFLLEALAEVAAEVFAPVAHLLNLDLDIVFVDTTSTYFQTERADALADLQDEARDDGQTNPVEAGIRAFGHCKDHREDLPQVLAMAVTRDGVPVRCWTFAGNATDTAIIRTVTDDLAGENLRRLVWVADRGFASAANRAYLTRGGGHFPVTAPSVKGVSNKGVSKPTSLRRRPAAAQRRRTAVGVKVERPAGRTTLTPTRTVARSVAGGRRRRRADVSSVGIS